MINYTWNINSMEVYSNIDGLSDVVFKISWECVGFDVPANLSGSCNDITFIPVNISGDFTPYEDLTQEQVLGWVYEAVGKDFTEAKVAAQIEEQKNPVTQVLPLPWA